MFKSVRPCIKNILSSIYCMAGRPHEYLTLKKHCVKHYSSSLYQKHSVKSYVHGTVLNRDPPYSKCRKFGCQLFRGVRTKTVDSFSLKKQVSPLSAKKPRKKKLPVEKEGIQKVIAYPLTDDEIDLENLSKAVVKIGLYNLSIGEDMKDVIHLTSRYSDVGEEFFVFREGSLVCWNVPDVERDEMISFLRKYVDDPYDLSLIIEESDGMEFTYVEHNSILVGDQLKIKKADHEVNTDKYAFSNALSQSVKLAVWESSLEIFIDSIRNITERLKSGSKIKISRQEVLRRHGEIFELRYLMNLNSELLFTPDFYWDRDQNLETLYKQLYNHLDIGRRTKVMNEKLNYCCQIIEVIDHKVSDAQHVRLEWFIIILILIEVVFETIHIYERYSLPQEPALYINKLDEGVR